MFNSKRFIVTGICALVFFSGAGAQAAMEWSVLKDIQLLDVPQDVAVTLDGATAFVLCHKSIQIVSMGERRVTGSIPVGEGYSKIAVVPAGDELVLTDAAKQKISVVQVSQVYDIPVGTSPVIGDPKAPVTMVAFLDYQCPYCSKAYPLLEQTLAKYPNDVKLVIKQFPLKFHNFAEPAALAALAAARQNKYKELSSLLMQNSSKLSEASIRQSAQQTGLDMEQFDAALKDPALKEQINKDMQEGTRCNVRGVPSIYINGKPIKSYTVESFAAQIQQEKNKKK